MISSAQNSSEKNTTISSKTIAIVGAGVTGTSMAIQLSEMAQARQLPIQLALIDSAKPGEGLPFQRYSTDPELDAAYSMAQPVERGWHNPQSRLAFAEYLNPENPQSIAHTFQPRSKFGEFIKNEYENAQKNCDHTQVKIEHRPFRVEALRSTDDTRFELRLENGGALNADKVVLAVGHDFDSQLWALKEKPWCFFYPFNLDNAKQHIENYKNKPLLVLGSGQGFLDIIDFLDRVGFQQAVHCVSSHRPSHYWLFDPAANSRNDKAIVNQLNAFKFYNCNFENLFKLSIQLNDNDYSALKTLNDLLELDLHANDQSKLGKMLLLEKLRAHIDEAADAYTLEQKGLMKNLIDTQMSRGISQSRFDLLEGLKNSGRFHWHQETLMPDHFTDLNSGCVSVHMPRADQEIEFGGVLNATAIARAPLNQQGELNTRIVFMKNLKSENHLAENPENPKYLQAGEQRLKGLYLAAGPNTHKRWVLETFAPLNRQFAEDILEQIQNGQAQLTFIDQDAVDSGSESKAS